MMFDMDEETGEDREGRVVRKIPTDTFAHRLILARSEAGHLTIQQAAARCGLRHQSWSNWERGMVPRGDQVELAEVIAEGLGIDRDWLLFGGPLTRPERSRRIRLTSFHSAARPGARRPRRLDRSRRRVAA